MTSLPSDPALFLLIPAALITAYNMGSSLISIRNAFLGRGRLYPTLYLASAALTACALLLDPRPECRWMILVPLADFSNFAVPWMVLTSIPKAWKMVWATLRNLMKQPCTPN